ncbi:MAG: hypothetical protein ACM3Q2_01730 [Syntrophothermus sp.]
MKNPAILVKTAFLFLIVFSSAAFSQMPKGYKGKPFSDSLYNKGPQVIPGRLETAYYDMGGEGIAYHDTDSSNNGSGVLNREPLHERPGVPMYICHFREKEGVDLSYTKDFADFNHPNMVVPPVNQLYIGWQADSEWVNYTVNVKKAGKYKITALYGYKDNGSSFWLNGKKAADIKLPVDTGNWHYWNKAEVGTIVFPKAGLNLLTLHYNTGSNLAYFDFELIK